MVFVEGQDEMAFLLDDPWVLSVDSRFREKYKMYIQNGPDNCDDLNGDVVMDKVTWRREVDSHLDDWR